MGKMFVGILKTLSSKSQWKKGSRGEKGKIKENGWLCRNVNEKVDGEFCREIVGKM